MSNSTMARIWDMVPEAKGRSFAFGSSRGGGRCGERMGTVTVREKPSNNVGDMCQKRRNHFFDSLEMFDSSKVWKIETMHFDFQLFW